MTISNPTATPEHKAEPGSRRLTLWRRGALTLLAVLPFLAVYIPHFTNPTWVPTGFIQRDMAHYAANGREVFERGNGFAYPNPYDYRDDAPVIYFHWLLWLLGSGVVKLGFDPGLLFFGIGVAGSVLMSWFTWSLVSEVLPRKRYLSALFLLAMWGGGLLCLGQIGMNILKGREPLLMFMRLDPFGGWWFLNWGRNLVFPTEALYHVFSALSWLAALRGRWGLSLLAASVLAATHHFSGLQLLLIHASWWALQLVLRRDRPALKWFAWTALALGAFLAYHLLYLPRFPEHRAIMEYWSLDWSISAKSVLMAYGPLAGLAATRLWLDRRTLTSSELFLVVCFAVSFLLVIHDRFMSPIEPLHFTRGYIWMPLCLPGFPFWPWHGHSIHPLRSEQHVLSR